MSKSKRATGVKALELSADRHALFSLMRQVVSLRKQVDQAERRLIESRGHSRLIAPQSSPGDCAAARPGSVSPRASD